MSDPQWPPPFPIEPEAYDEPLALFVRLLCWADGEEQDEEEDEPPEGVDVSGLDA